MPPTRRSRPRRHRRTAFAWFAVLTVAPTGCSTAADQTSDPPATEPAGALGPAVNVAPPVGDAQPPAATIESTAGGTPTDEDAGDEAALPIPTDPSAPTTSAAADTPSVSPLAEYLTGVPGMTDFDPARFQRESRAHEEAIARCMAAEGFEYIPHVVNFNWTVVDGGGLAVITPGGGELPDLSPEEFAAQYGYGLSTREPQDDAAETDVDPNDAIVDAMSVPERVAYYQTLLGAEQSLDGNGRPNAEMPGDPASCWEQASIEVWGEQQPVDATDPVLAAFAPLLEQVSAIEDKVAADPRMVAANEAWSECMAAAGYPGYTDLNAPQTDVAERAREVMGSALDPAEAEPEELAELQRFEIAIATADEACRAGYGETHQQVRYDIEAEFVEQHRVELEEYRDAVAAQAAG